MVFIDCHPEDAAAMAFLENLGEGKEALKFSSFKTLYVQKAQRRAASYC